MPDIVGVRFKPCGKIYNFETNGINVRPGMWIVVESEMGLNLGLIVKARQRIEQPEQQFKKILRLATVQDLETDRNNRFLEDEASTFCIERTKSLNLPMKIVGTEATLDKKRLIFYFAAEGRIDFRELVRDLASKFKTRIEMRQIGVRDEVKCVGGIGCCGREVCCKVFLTSFEPISIRMAKKQELVLNPGKLSGICGRLMCCLGYEIDQPVQQKTKEEAAGKETKDETVIVAEKEMVKEPGDEAVTVAPEVAAETVSYHGNSSQPKKEVEYYKEKAKLPRSSNTPKRTKPEGSKEKANKHERKDRGKPFNKRKKFWKKKRR